MFFVCFLYVFCQKYVFSMFVEMACSKSMYYVCFMYVNNITNDWLQFTDI